ncbi:unnamed protein product, partial [Meganyctiphanes norvegica]
VDTYLYSTYARITSNGATCNDIAAVYKHSVLLIKNADKISEFQPMSWESAELDLPEPLAYPVGIASDLQNGRLFVTDVMHIENSIFTLQFTSNGSIDAMYPLLKKTHTKDIRLIEDIFYDSHTSQLYWTDSYMNSLDKANVPENPQDMLTEKPKPVHNFGNVKKPRGIALDHCNNLLYWSELNDDDRNIEVCNLDGKYQGVVRTASDNSSEYFLGMTYDIYSGHVIWGETEGKELGSTCRIMSSDFRGTSDHEPVITQLAELDNCYPFALTSDNEYIYWADWSRNGIMRLSKTNPDQIVKILDAPKVESDEGTHHGIFGLTVLGGPSVEDIEKICSQHHTYFDKQTNPQDVSELKQHEQSIEAVKRDDPAHEISAKVSENIRSKISISTPFPDFQKNTKEIVAENSYTEAQQIEKQTQLVTEKNTKKNVWNKSQENVLKKPFNLQESNDAQSATESFQGHMSVTENQMDEEERQSVMQGLDKTFDGSQDYQSISTTVDEKIELFRTHTGANHQSVIG